MRPLLCSPGQPYFSYYLSPLNTLYLLYTKYGVLAMSLSLHTMVVPAVAAVAELGTTCEFSSTALPNSQSWHCVSCALSTFLAAHRSVNLLKRIFSRFVTAGWF